LVEPGRPHQTIWRPVSMMWRRSQKRKKGALAGAPFVYSSSAARWLARETWTYQRRATHAMTKNVRPLPREERRRVDAVQLQGECRTMAATGAPYPSPAREGVPDPDKAVPQDGRVRNLGTVGSVSL
jgi:hypothetical protein